MWRTFPLHNVDKMTIFHRLLGSTAEPELSPELKRRLAAIEEEQRLQTKGLKALELDWQEWYDKFRLLFMRLSKRIKDAAKVDGDDPESHEDAPGRDKRPAPGYGHPPLPRRNLRGF